MSDKYGFVYIWRDRKHKRYYIGCHWGTIDDGYVCSSSWMKQAYKHRPKDFTRRILKTNLGRQEMYAEENKWLNLMKDEEMKPLNATPRYYNLTKQMHNLWHNDPNKTLSIGQKISAAKKGKTQPYSATRAENISKSKKGKKQSPEHTEKLAAQKRGKKHSEEHKNKIRASINKAYAEGRL